jgi:starvation-inducible DNA-binding protein
MKEINIGIDHNERRKIADGLSRLLADTYTVYLKTQNFHWNVTGPLFSELHLLFEKQYQELGEAVDGIAERIRALDFQVPASYSEFSALSTVKETLGTLSERQMLAILAEGNEAVVRTARSVLDVAEKNSDQPTIDLIAKRMQVHEKSAWMLRSHLQGKEKEELKSTA